MNVKEKKIFSCNHCDSQYPKWQGRCTECGQWGTLEEGRYVATVSDKPSAPLAQTISFSDIKGGEILRFKTGFGEFDRVLGEGLVSGSVILLGGDPGIGKSTLALQVTAKISQTESVIYVSGEESAEQVKQRMDRLKITANDLHFISETDAEMVCATLSERKPQVAVIDSIQTLTSSQIKSQSGSPQQIKAVTAQLMEVAKNSKIAIVIIGHVTKQGAVAGPRTLEHLVDSVIYLEGDRYQSLRILRAIKNRFGSTSEIGIFEMKDHGLAEVLNPSALLLKDRAKQISGSVITCIMEGSRPFLVEVQALVTKAGFGYPQRKTSGFDQKRLQLLLAVLTKRMGIRIEDQDIHINVVGGVKIKEPSADLAVCLAIISALKNIPLPNTLSVMGEVGLGGEVRPVINIDKRLEESAKLGFKNIIIPSNTKNHKDAVCYPVKSINEASEIAFTI
ncbi:MAG: DNA repair protein RadA [Patescibacteria group bacterium]